MLLKLEYVIFVTMYLTDLSVLLSREF